MYSAKNILILLIVTTAVVTQYTPKPGNCPPFPDVGLCDLSCTIDDHCRGVHKCCPTACGGTFCTNPMTRRSKKVQDKPGFCPESPTGPWVCSSRCAVDTDCRGSRKCCKNRCGAMACTKAVSFQEELFNNNIF